MPLSFATASSQFLTMGATTGGQNVTGATLMVWVTLSALPGATERFLIRCTIGTGTTSSRIHISALAANTWRAGGRRLDADTFQSADGGTVATNTLTHVCARMTYNGQACELFVNGALVTTTTVAGWTGSSSNTAPQFLGAASASPAGANFLDGTLSDGRLYNRALSADEILTIYNSQGRDNIYESLLHKWQMNEGVTGSTVIDLIGNADGTPSGSPTYTTDQVPLKRRMR